MYIFFSSDKAQVVVKTLKLDLEPKVGPEVKRVKGWLTPSRGVVCLKESKQFLGAYTEKDA